MPGAGYSEELQAAPGGAAYGHFDVFSGDSSVGDKWAVVDM